MINDIIPVGNIKSLHASENNHFGSSVSIDNNLIAVGEPNAFINAANAGAAYVYLKDEDQ